VEAPRGIKGGPVFETAEDFSQFLIREKGISTVPWDDAGRYIRFSVTFTADEVEERRVINEFEKRLLQVPFVW
jgi:LL-diaminopimelate aminotransferase